MQQLMVGQLCHTLYLTDSCKDFRLKNINASEYKFRRYKKNYLLKPKFQLLFIGFSLVPALIVMALALADVSKLDLVIFTALISIAILIIGIIYSHRIVGPVYRIDMQMRKDAEEKKLTLIKFRKGDFFAELAGSYNVLAMSVNSKTEN
jgi:hypothetical protein